MAASAGKRVVHIGGGLTAGHTAEEDVSQEVLINDADPKTRYNLTKRTTQEDIMRRTSCVVSTRRAGARISPTRPENPSYRAAALNQPKTRRLAPSSRPWPLTARFLCRRGRYRPPGTHVPGAAKASADDKPLYLLVQPGAALSKEGVETKRAAVQARGRACLRIIHSASRTARRVARCC